MCFQSRSHSSFSFLAVIWNWTNLTAINHQLPIICIAKHVYSAVLQRSWRLTILGRAGHCFLLHFPFVTKASLS